MNFPSSRTRKAMKTNRKLIDNDPSEVARLESPDWTSQKMPQICVVELTQILRRFFEDKNFLKQYFNIRSKLGGNYIFFLSESRI